MDEVADKDPWEEAVAWVVLVDNPISRRNRTEICDLNSLSFVFRHTLLSILCSFRSVWYIFDY